MFRGRSGTTKRLRNPAAATARVVVAAPKKRYRAPASSDFPLVRSRGCTSAIRTMFETSRSMSSFLAYRAFPRTIIMIIPDNWQVRISMYTSYTEIVGIFDHRKQRSSDRKQTGSFVYTSDPRSNGRFNCTVWKINYDRHLYSWWIYRNILRAYTTSQSLRHHLDIAHCQTISLLFPSRTIDLGFVYASLVASIAASSIVLRRCTSRNSMSKARWK